MELVVIVVQVVAVISPFGVIFATVVGLVGPRK
jgi:hypothetical protein